MTRRFVLEELDRHRPHGATARRLVWEFYSRQRGVGDLPYLHHWDVEHAFRHFEQLGVTKVRHLGGEGNDAIYKARLTIGRRELAERIASLVIDAPEALSALRHPECPSDTPTASAPLLTASYRPSCGRSASGEDDAARREGNP
jgi:hypothetical protein